MGGQTVLCAKWRGGMPRQYGRAHLLPPLCRPACTFLRPSMLQSICLNAPLPFAVEIPNPTLLLRHQFAPSLSPIL